MVTNTNTTNNMDHMWMCSMEFRWSGLDMLKSNWSNLSEININIQNVITETFIFAEHNVYYNKASRYKLPLNWYIIKWCNTHMSDMFLKDHGWYSLSKQICNYGVCSNILYRQLTILDSFFHNKELSICLDFDELLLYLEYSTANLLSQHSLSGLLIPSTIRRPMTKFLNYISWLDAS